MFIKVLKKLINGTQRVFNRYVIGSRKISITRLDGISACIRLNDDNCINILYDQIKIIYDEIDEFLIHYNGIKNEIKLLTKFKKFEKIILRKYPVDGFDFVKYSNDFITEIKFKYMFIWDSDIIFDLEYLRKKIKSIKTKKINNTYYFSGINLLKDKNGIIGFSNLENNSICSSFVGCGDFFIHPVSVESDYFTKEKFVMNKKYFKNNYWGLMFIHLSLLKIDNNEVSQNLNCKQILQNLKEKSLSSYSRFWYKKIIKHTKKNVLSNLLKLKSTKFNDYKNLIN